MPFYNEIAHTPLFIWDPRTEVKGENRKSLVQTIDIAPTLLDFFEVEIPEDMQGKPLKETINSDKPVREAGLFGIHGGHVNCTDGRYLYMRGPETPDNRPLYQYTLMPTEHGAGRAFMNLDEIKTAVLEKPFSFTKECKVLKLKDSEAETPQFKFPTMLFDLKDDPEQKHPIENKEIEKQMIKHMIRLMKANDAPEEQFERLGLLK
jgi:hypothetical protein